MTGRGYESLPLRQIFYAFVSNHLQRNSELKGSAYGFQGISSEPRYETAKDKHIIEMAKQAAVQLEKKSVSENDGELHPYVGAVIVK